MKIYRLLPVVLLSSIFTFTSVAAAFTSPTLASIEAQLQGLLLEIKALFGQQQVLSTTKISPEYMPPPRTCVNGVLSGSGEYVSSTCSADSVNQPLLIGQSKQNISTLILKNGTILMMRSAAGTTTPGATKLVMEESIDNGKNWNMLAGAVPYKATVVNGESMLQLSSGRILATYHAFTFKPTPGMTGHTLEALYSDDNGLTWTHLSTVESLPVSPTGVPAIGVWESFLVQPKIRPRKIQVYYARERDDAEVCTTHVSGVNKGQDLVMKESADNGATWGPLQIVLRNGKSREGVPTIAETADGALYLAHEHLLYAGCQVKAQQAGFVPGIGMSKDGGMTWTDLQPAWAANANFVRASWPRMIRLADGRLAIRFGTGGPATGAGNNVVLLLTTNVPSLTNVPVWEKTPTRVMSNSMTGSGSVLQAANGDISVFGNNGSDVPMPQYYRTFPLNTLPRFGQ